MTVRLLKRFERGKGQIGQLLEKNFGLTNVIRPFKVIKDTALNRIKIGVNICDWLVTWWLSGIFASRGHQLAPDPWNCIFLVRQLAVLG